jgi:glycosyltransferase involved in cell wall biosynthesis
MEPLQQRSWAIAITARATYLKPWYEGFAAAMPPEWRALLICPVDEAGDHPRDLTTPVHPNLTIHEIPAARRTLSSGGGHTAQHYGARHRWLPDSRISAAMDAAACGGLIAHEFSPFTLTALLHAKRRRLPVVSFGDVGRDNAAAYPWQTRLWHLIWSAFIDGRMAGCPASRVPVSGSRLPFVESYHAVDSREFTPMPKPPAQPVTFVFSGQLIERKGLDLWFQAAARLVQAGHDDFRLRVVGGGDESWARRCAEATGVAHRVEWTGFLQRDAMKQALGKADVFVLPSRFDSYAVVVHEAACLGLPLLVSRHAGAAEAIVEEGINGWQVDPFDSADFAARMTAMLDSATRTRLGAAARVQGEKLCARRRGAAVWQWITDTYLN